MEPTSESTDQVAGLIVASHGRLLRVRTANGQELLARPQGRRVQAVCGDRVTFRVDAQHDAAQLVEVLPRLTALYRSDARGRGEPLAANVTLLLVVLAPLPAPDLFIVDRYLAAAACGGIKAALVANKCDLAFDQPTLDELAVMQQLGYVTVQCSSRSGHGIATLRAMMRNETAMLVGQSGVGKSSLLLELAPECGVAIGELMRDDAGRHTTTTSRLHQLDRDTALIDSPGVRDFAPAIDRLDPRTLGFREVEQLGGQCRFSDCAHLQEPDCAVRTAVAGGAMSARRYESYRRLRRLFNDLSPPPGGSRR
jgi:ribosome biogenesis GTPase